ncbi:MULTISPECIES: hypothetical protein [Tsukamurella]|uniref:Uncharacterized protein n=2 Tax=Tsukamurella TaxID=2060 RepID=A0A5C5S696_9ACTN|nr:MULTISPECIES: hypothetical protein [Tsukamurella]NMD56940.1 hypothetical protein [Tsukamurella columbiensis]TWS29841.1 hypothetical protein FK530_04710 [Tsukamurella conjunctivitidis]
MGMYDVNCAITGVSLTYTDAAMVILSRAPGGVYRPAALPMIGHYDYYGGITPDDSRNTELIAAGIAQATKSGRYWTDDGWPPGGWDPSIHEVISNLVRNMSDWLGLYEGAEPPSDSGTMFDGMPLVFALVARPVWDAIVADGERELDVATAFVEVFGDEPLPHALYGCGGGAPSSELTALAAVDRFLTARGLRWQSHADGLALDGFGQQHTDEQMLGWLDRAHTRFADDPVVLAGLDAYGAILTATIAELEESGPPACSGSVDAPSPSDEASRCGDPRPTASVTCGVHHLNGLTAWMPTWAVETDLHAPDRAPQATRSGLTVRETGVYLVTAQMPWEGAAGGESLMCKVYAEGMQILEATQIAMTWENISVISGLVPLTAGQRIFLSLIHSGPRAIAVGGPIQGGVQARLAMTRMA